MVPLLQRHQRRQESRILKMIYKVRFMNSPLKSAVMELQQISSDNFSHNFKYCILKPPEHFGLPHFSIVKCNGSFCWTKSGAKSIYCTTCGYILKSLSHDFFIFAFDRETKFRKIATHHLPYLVSKL